MTYTIESYLENTKREWAAPPDELSRQYTDYLLSLFSTHLGRIRFTSGMIKMALVSESVLYKQIANSCYESMLSRCKTPLDLLPIKLPPGDSGRSLEVSIAEATAISASAKDRGERIGLLHGHYRYFTPGNLAVAVMASEQCDVLVMGMERSSRTEKFKKSNTMFRDWERRRIILGSEIASYVLWISRLNYDNEGYERMVKDIAPDKYFGNASNPRWLQDEMRIRARVAGSDYIELPNVLSFSSTDIFTNSAVIPMIIAASDTSSPSKNSPPNNLYMYPVILFSSV